MKPALSQGALIVALLAGAPGCATTPTGPPLTGNLLLDAPASIQSGPPRDRVLWEYRLAAAAMRQADYTLARQSLDSALARVGNIFTADKGSRAARSYFKEEAKKTFLGEPYERVMANYYRGILYWMDGEPDNARACFRNGQFQDADAENQEYAADWVLLDYLDGLVTTRLGSDGGDAFKRAKANARLAIPPEPKPRANLLFFLEYGQGPTKYAAGQYGEQLRFKEGASTTREVMVRVGGQAVHVGPYDDLNFQATTRGGRVMDHVLGNKAVFKATTDTFGDAAIMGGAITAMAGSGRGNSMDEVGAGLVIAGVLSKLVSAASTPRADTRGWENLPLYLSFAAFEVPPGTHAATIEFLDARRQPLANLTRTVSISIPTPETTRVVFVSDRSTLPQSL